MMITINSKKWLLSWTIAVCLLGGLAQAKEPISAPALPREIPSPRITPRTAAPQNQDLLQLVEEAIEVSSRRYLVANQHSPWQIYHGIGALRREFMLDLDGELVPAIDWLSTTNPQFRGTHWFEKTVYGGRAQRYTVPYHFEGHPNQSFALMVMCNLPTSHTFMTAGGPVTVADMINHAKVDLNPREELTWTLWFLTHYLTSEDTWMTRRGETWSLERLVQDQIRTEVTKAACGGTHNLYALSVARNNHVRNGGAIRGVWLQADQKIKRYMVAARSLQRRDGSFPTHYFRGYGNPRTFSEQIASTGHMMEWLMVAVDDKQFTEEWVERGIRYVAQKLIDHRHESAECGPLYHTVSALALYRDRAKGVAWPNPAIQPESGQVVPEQLPALVQESATPAMVPNPTQDPVVTVPAPVAEAAKPAPERVADAKPMQVTPGPSSAAANPPGAGSVVEQSTQGKLSVGIDESEMELEFVLPDKIEKTAEKPQTENAQAEMVAEKPDGTAQKEDKSQQDEKSETAKSDSKSNEDAVKPQEPAKEAEVEILAAPEAEGTKK